MTGGAVRAVIFDVDGTLVDSERDGHRVAFNLAFEQAGLADRWDVETYGRLLRTAGGRQRLAGWFEEQGNHSADALALAKRLHPEKTRLMRELVQDGRIRPRPGVPELLEDLSARGVRLSVATTGTRAWVEPLLSRLFGGCFSTIVTGTEIRSLKPDPAAYLEVLRLTGSEPATTVAIEDSANGVRAALAAGLRCVAVANDYTREQDLEAADLLVEDFADPTLIAWFQDRVAR